MYWDYYKDKEIIPANNTTNTNDYGGYSPKLLYVEKKYANYKQELLQHLSIYQYEMCAAKANMYIGSERAKECYFKPNIEMELMISRGIKLGAFILMHHLLSIIVYCDLDIYSRQFSETFRKLQSQKHSNPSNSAMQNFGGNQNHLKRQWRFSDAMYQTDMMVHSLQVLTVY